MKFKMLNKQNQLIERIPFDTYPYFVVLFYLTIVRYQKYVFV